MEPPAGPDAPPPAPFVFEVDVAEASGGGIGGLIRNIPVFARQVRAETDKVVWPTRAETVRTAIMVVVMTLLLGIFFFAVDWGFSRIVRALLKLA